MRKSLSPIPPHLFLHLWPLQLWRWVLLSFLLTGNRLATAQDLPLQYVHDVWTTERGLPQNSVSALVQTRDGYLWVGTYGGLARFDGIRFTVFETGNAPGMQSNRILTLYEDRAGNLWIGTDQGGLSRYFQGKFSTYTTQDGLPDNYVAALAEDHVGGLWIVTSKGLARLQDGRFTTYTPQEGWADGRVGLVKAGRDGSIWVVFARGLAHWRAGRFETYPFPADIKAGFGGPLTGGEGRDGSLWIAGRGA
jgi:ligand-binding sensor domain-containing protein